MCTEFSPFIHYHFLFLSYSTEKLCRENTFKAKLCYKKIVLDNVMASAASTKDDYLA